LSGGTSATVNQLLLEMGYTEFRSGLQIGAQDWFPDRSAATIRDDMLRQLRPGLDRRSERPDLDRCPVMTKPESHVCCSWCLLASMGTLIWRRFTRTRNSNHRRFPERPHHDSLSLTAIQSQLRKVMRQPFEVLDLHVPLLRVRAGPPAAVDHRAAIGNTPVLAKVRAHAPWCDCHCGFSAAPHRTRRGTPLA
jgi:hypothetical protein